MRSDYYLIIEVGHYECSILGNGIAFLLVRMRPFPTVPAAQ